MLTLNDGCRLHVAAPAAGDGKRPEALILSNSLGTDVSLWDQQVSALSAGRSVWRYDTRGHGQSDAPAGDYTIERLGRDLLAVMDQAGLESADLCGISIGGMTALWIAINEPARVRRLVLANTAARIGTLDLWHDRMSTARSQGIAALADGSMQRWFTAGFREREPATIEHFRSTMASTKAAGYLGCAAALRDADLRESVSAVRARTLVITGTHDPATTPADGEWLRDRIPGAQLVELDAAHLSNVEAADQFNAAVSAFLGRGSAPSR